MMKRSTVASLLALAVVFSQAEAAPPPYSVTDLGPVAENGAVVGISNTGHVLLNDGDRPRLIWTNGTGWIKDLYLDSHLASTCSFTAPVDPLNGNGAGISHNGKVVIGVASQDFTGTDSWCVAVFTPEGSTWTYNSSIGYHGGVTGVNDAGQVIAIEL
jgi:hypothetical protein